MVLMEREIFCKFVFAVVPQISTKQYIFGFNMGLIIFNENARFCPCTNEAKTSSSKS